MDLCLDMVEQQFSKESSLKLTSSNHYHHHHHHPRGLDHSSECRAMARQYFRQKGLIAVAMILSIAVTVRFHVNHMDPTQIVYQRSMEAVYPPATITTRVRNQRPAAVETHPAVSLMVNNNNNNATKRKTNRKPHGPSILDTAEPEPVTYGGPITADGKMTILTKEEIESSTKDGLKLRRVYYFSSFANPKRKALMEDWLEPLGVPYERIEPMIGDISKCNQNEKCLSALRLSNTYQHFLNPDLSHVHDISGTVLVVDNGDTSVDMDRLDKFLGNFTEKWQVLRLDCDQPSPDNPDAIWYPQPDTDKPGQHECVRSNAILWRRGSLNRLKDRMVTWDQNPNLDINCMLAKKQKKLKTMCVNLGITTKHQMKGKELGVVRNSWVLRKDGWSLDQMRHEAELEPTENPNTMTQIDRIYYHNLDKNDLRQRHMESWLNEQPIPYKRIPAKVGSPEDVCVPDKNTPNRCRGMAGILKTLNSIIDNENTTGVSLVMEDDVITMDKKDRLGRMEEAIKYVPDDWDIIRFDCWGSEQFDTPAINGFVIDTRKPEPHPWTIGDGGDWPSFCGGAYAMLWRDSSVHKLKKMWSMNPVDDADCVIASTEYVQSYCVNIGLFQHYYIKQEMSDVSMLRD